MIIFVTVTAGLVLAFAGLSFTGTGGPTPRVTVPARPAAAVPDAVGQADRYLQVVAHEDDDLLFMNPDIQDVVTAGHETVTVFLTAGEGRAKTYDPQRYSESRERGIRTAYARMAGVPDRWNRNSMTAGPLTVQVDTLAARPTVRLVWFRLPDGADGRPGTVGKQAMTRLQKDLTGTFCAPTVVPPGSPFARCVSRADLLAALQSLVTTFRSTVVRYQDTQPDGHDHKDHIAAARLTAEAVRGVGDPRLIEIGYIDYPILRLPANLGPGQRGRKKTVFEGYRHHDRLITKRKLRKYWAWTQRMYRRWPGGGVQLARGPDGLLRAFAVEQGGLYVWTQRTAERWSGPLRIDPGFPLNPSISVGVGGDRWLVAARRNDDTHGIVLFQADKANAWQVTRLGAPGRKGDHKLTGAPAVTATADGRVMVLVRTGRGTLAMRTQDKPQGGFGRWRDLGGQNLRDGLAVTPAGRSPVQVFAASDDDSQGPPWLKQAGPGTVVRWREDATGRLVRGEDIGYTAPAGPLRLAAGPGGVPQLVRRDPASGEYLLQTEQPDGTFSAPQRVGGAAGIEAPALVATGAGAMICARGSLPAGTSCAVADDGPPMGRGGRSAAIPQRQAFGRWTSLGGPIVGPPSLALDSTGRAVVATLGHHGRLLINRQQAPGAPAFGGWREIAETP
ncbi:PIG-L family deacetylase [Spirillospora sp. NPDC048911]|uniref:PIG-L family deacetylase n=1 Tax=Spirillospora sp. NPDC048911 TaxID=3364527 RepID=UPI00371305AC